MVADLWAAGVTLYMFLFGRVPFLAEDKEELFALIREREIEFPLEPGRKPVSSDSISLLKQMLTKQPAKVGVKISGTNNVGTSTASFPPQTEKEQMGYQNGRQGVSNFVATCSAQNRELIVLAGAGYVQGRDQRV